MLDYTKTSLHFKIISEIGSEGKNSTVHIAHDFQLDTEIVVKRISKSDFIDNTKFFDEAKKLYSSNHPNIAQVQYSCQDDEFIYITMPFFHKGSLNQLIDKRPLKVSEILKYSIDFLSGLHHIHTKRLIHCDIKPNNILISNSNDAVLTDFGLAKYLNSDGYSIVDKFYHLHQPPEILQSGIITHQGDIFQAGLTIYRLCNGNAFFKRQIEKYFRKDKTFDNDKFLSAVYNGDFPNRSDYFHHIPQTLRNYIRKALSPNPADRYQTILDFLNDLAKVEINYDWQMFPDRQGCLWVSSIDDKEYKVLVSPLQDGFAAVKTTKLTQIGAGERNISAYSKRKVTFDEAYKIAKQALNNNSL